MGENECPGCGSTLADRTTYAAGADDVPLGFRDCPHCGTAKCCMCDMGDDVECVSCDGDAE